MGLDVLIDLDHIYTKSEVSTLLAGKSDVSHTHDLSEITDAGTAASHDVPSSGDAASGEVVKGDDSRLTDPRTPTTHYHDDRYYTESETDSLLAGKASSSHTHTLSDVTDAGTAAALDVPSSGDAASDEVVKGNDSRLTDPRAPTTHYHDDRYYRESEMDLLLADKADDDHDHDEFVPIGGIIFYDTGISGASYPSGTWAKCEGGSLPDLTDKFLLPSTTAGSTSTTQNHTHTISYTNHQVSPCGGGGGTTVSKITNANTGSSSHMPPYHKLLTLARHA